MPRTAPGDTIEARWAAGGRFARGVLTRVVTPSPDRVEPPCPHYTRDHCGGCQLQHLALPAQHAAKQLIVQDALARIGGRAARVDPVTPGGGSWRYRRKLTLALRRRASAWLAGLHPYDDPGAVFALDDCPITAERVVDVWRTVLAAGEFLPIDADELRGAVQCASSDDLAHAGANDLLRTSFTLEGGRTWRDAAAFFAAVPALTGLWWRPQDGGRRLLYTRETAAAALGGASFAQVNAEVASRLRADVLAAARALRPTAVVDAYAGAGAVAAALAAEGAHVTAIELDTEASAVAAARLAPFGGRSVQGRVEAVLGDVLPADLVIVNPPRTGLDAAVPALLERAAAGAFGGMPRGMLYVSCNPATLARDLARLPSYAVERVTPYDMFPQTAHVETLVVLTLASADAGTP